MESLNGWQWFGLWLALVAALAGWAVVVWWIIVRVAEWRKKRRLRKAMRLMDIGDLYKQDPREPFHDE